MIIKGIHDSSEYKAIQAFYGTRTTERSKIPLMNHIDEGIVILRHYGANLATVKAFIIHPLFQHDDQLTKEGLAYTIYNLTTPLVMLYVMEYRRAANACLLEEFMEFVKPKPSPLADVNLMLKADKIQNRKDFEQYHKGIHENSIPLTQYFNAWLRELGVGTFEYEKIVKLIS